MVQKIQTTVRCWLMITSRVQLWNNESLIL
jgi:hypothetical protein